MALIPTPLTANQLSVLLVAIGFYSAWLFSLGHYVTGVIAAFLSLAASILDGCDGEIARLKYQESALGCWIETFGDYSYYIAIFIGLTIGAARKTHVEAFYWIGGLALCGTLVSFALLIFLRARITAGRPERLHAIAAERFKSEPTFWSRLDLAAVVHGDPIGDAIRHLRLRARQPVAGDRGAGRDRQQRLLDQPGRQAARADGRGGRGRGLTAATARQGTGTGLGVLPGHGGP